jgi:ABC-type phosphate/phosphonate transport system substrate-binding protein
MIVNARMYSVAPAAKAAWRGLLGWIVERAGLRMQIVDHDPPATLHDLWQRADLGCAMMCGLPYALRDPRPILIAAPIAAPSRFAGRAVYFSDIAVRADSSFQRLEDTFGATCGYTLADSMSGCVAFRRLLHRHRRPGDPRLYKAVVGDLINARGVIQALADGRIDVGPLDGYVHELLKHLDPQFAARIRVVATAEPAPMPPFVATARLNGEEAQRLRSAFAASIAAPELKTERETLLLKNFAFPAPGDYDVFHGILRTAQEYAETW